MNKLNIFAIFGVMFFSSILLGNGMYSNQIFAQQENEAEVNADIEQENKCKKHTECENENELNNTLSITNITTITQQQQEEQPETPTCETCFTDNMSEEELANFIDEFFTTDNNTLDEVCEYIDEHQGEEALNNMLLQSAEASISPEQYEALIQCLQDAGFDVSFPPE